MSNGQLEHQILSLFEEAACFDEFQNFGIDPDADIAFEDYPEMEELEF